MSTLSRQGYFFNVFCKLQHLCWWSIWTASSEPNDVFALTRTQVLVILLRQYGKTATWRYDWHLEWSSCSRCPSQFFFTVTWTACEILTTIVHFRLSCWWQNWVCLLETSLNNSINTITVNICSLQGIVGTFSDVIQYFTVFVQP